MLGLEDLQIVLGEVEPLLPPLPPLPADRVPHARQEIDVRDAVPENVGSRLGDLLSARAGPRHAVIPRGILRQRAENTIQRILPDHPLAAPGQDVLPVHLLDRVGLQKVFSEIIGSEFGIEESESLPELLQSAEGLIDVSVGHEKEAVVEGEQVLEKVDVLDEPLVPLGVAEIHDQSSASSGFPSMVENMSV